MSTVHNKWVNDDVTIVNSFGVGKVVKRRRDNGYGIEIDFNIDNPNYQLTEKDKIDIERWFIKALKES